MESAGAGSGGAELFEVSPSPETAAEHPGFEGANVCRAAALSTLFGGSSRLARAIEPELDELGFHPALSSGERTWRETDPRRMLSSWQAGDGEARPYRWEELAETADPEVAMRFLVEVLGSRLERESAAAAAALWRQLTLKPPRTGFREGPNERLGIRLTRIFESQLTEAQLPWAQPEPGVLDEGLDPGEFADWDPDGWVELYERTLYRLGNPDEDVMVIALLAGARLGRALRSPDPITRSLARAAFVPSAARRSERDSATRSRPPAPDAPPISTMVHGTWGWKGDWWRPSGGFHQFIRAGVRPDLYALGARFSWSGAYSEAQRDRAAVDFREWTETVAPEGLHSVFAHSYGGEVGARAVTKGAVLNELVLLSSPVTGPVLSVLGTALHVVDVRLHFDPVLGLARVGQRLPAAANATPVVLRRWELNHGATHEQRTWEEENVARRAGI